MELLEKETVCNENLVKLSKLRLRITVSVPQQRTSSDMVLKGLVQCDVMLKTLDASIVSIGDDHFKVLHSSPIQQRCTYKAYQA